MRRFRIRIWTADPKGLPRDLRGAFGRVLSDEHSAHSNEVSVLTFETSSFESADEIAGFSPAVNVDDEVVGLAHLSGVSFIETTPLP